MRSNYRVVRQFVAIKRQVVAVILTSLALLAFAMPAQGLEIGISGHQGTEYQTQGFEFIVSDNFSRRSPFYWNVAFSRYDEVFIEWNNNNLKLPINSAEISFSYRPRFSSRNPNMRGWSMEYRLGAAASLTDNKFTWTDLNKEKYFSETGDINGFIAISAHYKITSNLSANVGVKHFPKMSEFGSVSSAFLGFRFNLNFAPTYYGN